MKPAATQTPTSCRGANWDRSPPKRTHAFTLATSNFLLEKHDSPDLLCRKPANREIQWIGITTSVTRECDLKSLSFGRWVWGRSNDGTHPSTGELKCQENSIVVRCFTTFQFPLPLRQPQRAWAAAVSASADVPRIMVCHHIFRSYIVSQLKAFRKNKRADRISGTRRLVKKSRRRVACSWRWN